MFFHFSRVGVEVLVVVGFLVVGVQLEEVSQIGRRVQKVVSGVSQK